MNQDNQTLKQRREKADNLEATGTSLYTNQFKPDNAIQELLPKGESLEPQEKETGEAFYSVAGRVMAMRKFGKAAFCQITDKTGT